MRTPYLLPLRLLFLLSTLTIPSMAYAQSAAAAPQPEPQPPQKLRNADLEAMGRAQVSCPAQVAKLRASPHDFDSSGKALAQLKEAGVCDEALLEIIQPTIYIGWSVLPSKVLRDNYGHHIMDKYFGIDIAVYNRSEDKALVVRAFEFILRANRQRDISADPALVRGSLQKGELTGKRNVIVNSIKSIPVIFSPAAALYRNPTPRANFQTAVGVFTGLGKALDIVVPDTILTYLETWDKTQVFKEGFVVPAAGSTQGRIFIPIELIYPRSDPKWKKAHKGNYDPGLIKAEIGELYVLGQVATPGAGARMLAQ